MSKTGALDLASGVGGKIKKKEVQSAVEQYGSNLCPLIFACIVLIVK